MSKSQNGKQKPLENEIVPSIDEKSVDDGASESAGGVAPIESTGTPPKANGAAKPPSEPLESASEQEASKSGRTSLEDDPDHQAVLAENKRLKKQRRADKVRHAPETPAVQVSDGIDPLAVFYEALDTMWE